MGARGFWPRPFPNMGNMLTLDRKVVESSQTHQNVHTCLIKKPWKDEPNFTKCAFSHIVSYHHNRTIAWQKYEFSKNGQKSLFSVFKMVLSIFEIFHFLSEKYCPLSPEKVFNLRIAPSAMLHTFYTHNVVIMSSPKIMSCNVVSLKIMSL